MKQKMIDLELALIAAREVRDTAKSYGMGQMAMGAAAVLEALEKLPVVSGGADQ